jgi:hypothetical protein
MVTPFWHENMIETMITWAGKRDSPAHFLSSQAVGSMFVPPKLAAWKKTIIYEPDCAKFELKKSCLKVHENYFWEN